MTQHQPSRRDGRRGGPGDGSKAPVQLRTALDQLASTMGLASVDGLNHLFLGWSDVVGEELATHCSPKRLQSGTLTVEARDRLWAIELEWMTDLIAERCCDALGEDAVTKVRIVAPN